MDIQPQDILELMKSVPMMHAELAGLKSSISGMEKDLESFSKAINSVNTSLERVDGKVVDMNGLKYSVQSMQDSMHDLLLKMKDMAEKYRDVMDAIKAQDRTNDEHNREMMRTVHDIESNVKTFLNHQESQGNVINAMSNSIDNLSRRGNAMEKAAAQPANTETMFERIIKVAPNFIAIITFLGYIIYTLIEHKLMGKM